MSYEALPLQAALITFVTFVLVFIFVHLVLSEWLDK